MAKLRKVLVTRQELIRCLLAFHGEEFPRTGTSHARYRCLVNGQARHVTVDESIDEFTPRSHTPLYYIVLHQLQVTWEDFYAADAGIASRAGIPHRPPT